jgi:DNA replication initiation complex subunit (GINS family)
MYYSQSKKSRRTEDKKVITEPRGIFTKPPKKGIVNEAFFSNMMAEEKEIINRLKEMSEKDREEFLKKVQSRKKGGQPPEFKAKFKPGGPQEYFD